MRDTKDRSRFLPARPCRYQPRSGEGLPPGRRAMPGSQRRALQRTASSAMAIDEAMLRETALSDSGPLRPATAAAVTTAKITSDTFVGFDVRSYHAVRAINRLRHLRTYTGWQRQNSGQTIKSWMKAANFR